MTNKEWTQPNFEDFKFIHEHHVELTEEQFAQLRIRTTKICPKDPFEGQMWKYYDEGSWILYRLENSGHPTGQLVFKTWIIEITASADDLNLVRRG